MTIPSSGEHAALVCIEPDHPCLPGHFPGTPIVPGVLLVERVLEAAEAWVGRPLPLRAVPGVKFPSSLRPGEQARALLRLEGTRLAFRVEHEGRLIAQGSLTLAEVPAPAQAAP